MYLPESSLSDRSALCLQRHEGHVSVGWGVQIPFRLTKASVRHSASEGFDVFKRSAKLSPCLPLLQCKFKETFIIKRLNCNESLSPVLDYNVKFIYNFIYQKCPNSWVKVPFNFLSHLWLVCSVSVSKTIEAFCKECKKIMERINVEKQTIFGLRLPN